MHPAIEGGDSEWYLWIRSLGTQARLRPLATLQPTSFRTEDIRLFRCRKEPCGHFPEVRICSQQSHFLQHCWLATATFLPWAPARGAWVDLGSDSKRDVCAELEAFRRHLPPLLGPV
jgi:hypothetical protein